MSEDRPFEFLVERPDGAQPLVHLTFDESHSLTSFTDALALAENAGRTASIWVHGTNAERQTHLESMGFTSNRTLLQMSAPLPNQTTDVVTRAFTENDIDEFVDVNNRAFSWHPEQSGLTADAVRNDMGQPWFDPEGFRLHHIDGKLAAFCWTKRHYDSGTSGTSEDSGEAHVGEIYVIAVDPPFHGRGLGKALTLAGLEHLSSLGITNSMLYVESDNTAAVATYEKLGFTVSRTDTLWRHP